jgi:Fe-S cluster assembly protein SufD
MSSTASPTHPLLADLGEVLARRAGEPGRLADLRLRAAALFEQSGIPSRSLEAWRFTGLKHLEGEPYPIAAAGASPPPLEPWALDGAHTLVFVDGRLQTELSHPGDLPDGMSLRALSELPAAELAAIGDRLVAAGTPLEHHAFAALNTALFDDAALLHVEPKTVVEQPVLLLFASGEHRRPTTSLPRVLIELGESSQATVVESYVGPARANGFTCALTEVVLEAGAVLDHYALTEEGAGATHVSGLHSRQSRSSALRSHAFTLGGKVVRHDVAATLAGEGSDATLNGLYLTGDRQHVDNQLRVHHARPHCTSHQLYKGVLDDASKTVFNGRIVVDPGAQKTDARQSNRNLLLSETAKAQSNPQLEIYADDVRCTHGSTVGRLDDEAVFYLRSRGIDKRSAENLLTFAFAAEIVDGVRVEQLRRRLREALFSRLPGARLIRETP